MGILGNFGIENYAWRLGIVQGLCEYCWFCCVLLDPKCPDTQNLHTTFVLQYIH